LNVLKIYYKIDVDVIISALSFLNKLIDNKLKILQNICKLFDSSNRFIEKGVDDKLLDREILSHINYNVESSNGEEIFINHLIKKNYDEILCQILIKYTEHEGVVFTISNVFCKIFKSKIGTHQLMNTFMRLDMKNSLKNILELHECNSNILSKSLYLIFYQLDHIDLDFLLSDMINFKKLREILLNFKMNNFDSIHEIILQLIKGILSKKNIDNKIYSIGKDQYQEVITIFSNSFLLLRNKIISIDISKLVNWSINILTNIYTIVNIINNINKIFLDDAYFCNEKRICEILIEIYFTLYEKNLYPNLNKYNLHFSCLINTKMMIFRSLFHSITLIKNLRASTPMVSFVV
jgi:hypothetical protein